MDLPGIRLAPPAEPAHADSSTDGSRWPAVLRQLGGEIAGPLTSAVERIDRLAATGRIERHCLRALRSELDQVRRAAMVAQQLARYAGGRVRQSQERLDLAQAIRSALGQREREAEARGVPLRLSLKPAHVIADATLLFSLAQAVLDWALPLARSPIEVRLEHTRWPAHARWSCRFTHRAPDQPAEADAVRATLDTLPWQLLQQIGWAMGLTVERHDDASQTVLGIEFPRTVNDSMEGVSTIELDADGDSTPDSRPMAGSHVLVVAPPGDLRSRVHDAIRRTGMIIDFSASVTEARAFCAEGLPHAIVYDVALADAALEGLRAELQQQAPGLVFVEVGRQGKTWEACGPGAACAQVGLDAVASGLPAVLVMELTKNL